MIVDNFALSTFQTCGAKYDLRIRQGWASRRKSPALTFGEVAHVGIATWYKTGSEAETIAAIHRAWPGEAEVEDYRDLAKCERVMREYIAHYPFETFEVVGFPENPIIECPFTLPTGMYLDCPKCGTRWIGEVYVSEGKVMVMGENTCVQCGTALEPIYYGGIWDGLISFNDYLYTLEHKTTSRLDSYYFHQFKPNGQVTGYTWAGTQLTNLPVGGTLINAIGVYKASATRFEREITCRTPEEIAEWLRNVRAVCVQIDDCLHRGYFPLNTSACTLYKLCTYHSVHVLGTANERSKLLEQDFIIEPWDHNHRRETKED